jgi:hypothetical protein
MDRPMEPDAVPGTGAKPAGEIRARWAWVEASVWTERMLTALNAFFAALGLFSLPAAHTLACQSSRR